MSVMAVTPSHSNLDYFKGSIERSGSVPPTGLIVPFGGGCVCPSKTCYLGTEFSFFLTVLKFCE